VLCVCRYFSELNFKVWLNANHVQNQLRIYLYIHAPSTFRITSIHPQVTAYYVQQGHILLCLRRVEHSWSLNVFWCWTPVTSKVGFSLAAAAAAATMMMMMMMMIGKIVYYLKKHIHYYVLFCSACSYRYLCLHSFKHEFEHLSDLTTLYNKKVVWVDTYKRPLGSLTWTCGILHHTWCCRNNRRRREMAHTQSKRICCGHFELFLEVNRYLLIRIPNLVTLKEVYFGILWHIDVKYYLLLYMLIE